MASPIDQIIINNLINQLSNVGQPSNATPNNSTAVANLIAQAAPNLADALFNSTVPATVTTSGLANILANNSNAINVTNTTNQLNILIPQVADEAPTVQTLLTTNQTTFQPGQQVQVQIPDASAFVRTATNNIVANVNILSVNPQTNETQTFNGRLNIIIPSINTNLDSNQFIQQDINNPNTLLGRNFSAYFIQTPDDNVTTQFPAELTKPGLTQEIIGLHIKINTITLPTATQTTSALPTPTVPGNFTGSIIYSADSETIINTNIGTLRLPVNLQLPVGTHIEFNISSIDTKNLQSIPELNINNIDVLKQYLNSDNSAIKQLLSALQDPAAAANAQSGVVQSQIPNTTDKFIMARAIWFLGNIANASPEKWLSDESRNNIKKSSDGNNLIGRLDGLFKTLRSFFSNNEQVAQQGWNNFVVPFMDSDNELNYVNFFTERDASNEQDNSGDKALRFIVELNNSYYGEVQIDGLLSRHPTSKTLDVFFRYTGDITEADKNNIRDIFQNTISASELKGNLIFQQTEAEDIPHPYEDGKVSSQISQTGYII